MIVLGKKALPELGDNDILPLSNCEYVISQYVRDDLWKRRRQFQKSTAELQEGEAMMMTMLDEEQKQAMGQRRLTAGPLGGVYARSLRGIPMGYLGKVSVVGPAVGLDGEGNIVRQCWAKARETAWQYIETLDDPIQTTAPTMVPAGERTKTNRIKTMRVRKLVKRGPHPGRMLCQRPACRRWGVMTYMNTWRDLLAHIAHSVS